MTGPLPNGASAGPLWPPGHRAALSLCINVSEPQLGDEPAPLVPEPWYERSGADRLLRLLADADVTATWTWSRPSAISEQLIAQVGAAGHEIAARLRDDQLPSTQWEPDLVQTIETLTRATGAAVAGVKATGDTERGRLYETIQGAGLAWVIDQAYGDVPLPLGVRRDSDAPPLIHLPTSRSFDDRQGALRDGRDAAALLALWRDDLDVLRAEGGLMVLSLHPSVIGRPGLSRGLAHLLDLAIEAGDLWLAPANAIASWWRQRPAPGVAPSAGAAPGAE